MNKKKKFCSECGQTISKKLKNHIAVVLDCSGSMENIKKEAMNLFNTQIKTLREEASDMDNKVTLITFSSKVNDPIYDGVDLDSVKDMGDEDYKINGWTALYDAIGNTVNRLSEKDNGEEAFLVIVVTDGAENWSSEYKMGHIAKMIKEKEAKGNWTFTFLGANQDVILTQKNLGLSLGNVREFDSTVYGTKTASMNLNAAIGNYCQSRREGNLSVDNFYNDTDDDKEKE